jgi:putative peptidoglycan lipid II flippase
MKKATILLMVLTLLTKVIVFARDLVLANYYGASAISDAFLISITIPSLLFALLGTAIKASYIPIISELKLKKNEDDINLFTSGLIKFGLIISIFIILFIYIYPESILNLFASGFNTETKELTIGLLKITIFSMTFSLVIELLSGHLQSNGRFLIQAIASVPMNLIMLLFVIISNFTTVYMLPIGYLISLLTNFIIILFFSYRSRFRFYIKSKILSKDIKYFLMISIPIFISSGASDISQMIDKSFASNLISGSVSALDYASKISSLTQSIVIVSIGVIILPLLSGYFNNNQRFDFLNTIKKANKLTFIIVLPIMLISLSFSREIVIFLFQRGEFQEEAVYLTSIALFYYSIALISKGLKQNYYRAFYSMSNTRIPMYNSLLSIVINILLNIVFFYFTDLGIGGLALSTSIAIIITSIVLIIQFQKKMNLKLTSIDLNAYWKILSATILALVFTVLTYHILNIFIDIIGFHFAFIVTIITFIILYLILLFIFNEENIIDLLKKLKYMKNKIFSK